MKIFNEPKINGRLKILNTIRINGSTYYNCICLCGKKVCVHSGNLKRTKSCGCLNKEVSKARFTKHGERYSDEYRIWSGMKSRCNNPNTPKYKDYGGRNINVSKEWDSFVNFLNDMGRRPSKKHSIDRINNDGDYCKENCRWTTNKVQANNSRRNHLLTYNGKIQSLSLWSKELGINYATLKCRINVLKWSVEKALYKPVRIIK